MRDFADDGMMEAGSTDLRNYYRADRLCRKVRPSSQDFIERSTALARLGFADAAAADVEKAEEAGARDLSLLRWLLRDHPEAIKQTQAARSVLSCDQASQADIDDAVNCLFESGERVVHLARRRGARIRGWLASLDRAPPSIDLQFGDGRQMSLPLSFAPMPSGRARGLRASFDVRADPSLSASIFGRVGDATSQPTIVYPEALAPSIVEGSSHRPVDLSVIVPIFGDPDSLGHCLEALAAQSARRVAFIVIDDASSDPEIAEIGRQFCRKADGLYRRLPVNGGFAAAINHGLSLCPSGDVLLLNSDVVLPSGALDRLRTVARSASDIGTVSPLSNDSGATGFPDPLRASPVLDVADRIEVDRAAQAAHPDTVVDLLAALGSCLYITRGALSRVGPLSLAYGRGYYEDTDFYLRVRQAGLRNVAACGLYVSHTGGRSFGSEKRALVARNQVILRRRFPDFELDDVVFDLTDPLRMVRAGIEERLRPRLDDAVVIVGPAAGSEALFEHRTTAWRVLERPVLLMRWRRTDTQVDIDLAVAEGPGPRSLRFTLTSDDGDTRALTYLKAWVGLEVEVLEPEHLPLALFRLLKTLGRPLGVVIESPASAATLVREAGASPLRWRSAVSADRPVLKRVVPLDRMAAAWLAPAGVSRSSRPPSRSRPRNRGREIGKLGVSFPRADAAAELLILCVARHLCRGPSTTVVVFGRAIDERQLMSPGNVWVTGPLLGDDPGTLARQYGVDALLSPYRASMFWHVETLGHRLGVPIAYFDWSQGRLAQAPADLALDHRLDDTDAGREIGAWCSGDRSTSVVRP